MTAQEHIQQKPQVTVPAPRSHNGLKPRGFAVPTKPYQTSERENQQPLDFKTQLNRATRFGHNLSHISALSPSSSASAVQAKTITQNQPIQQQEEQEEPEQMKAANASPISQQPQMQKPGASEMNYSMPKPLRAKMEKSFGTSFSDVKIHGESAQAKAIGALAYTQGNNIHFAPGAYNPQSASGQALLGHELAHVTQQRAGRVPVPHQRKGLPINADPSLENEADVMGAKAARGESIGLANYFGNKTQIGNLQPVQNSEEPVQCFLPLLLGAGSLLGGLFGGGGGGGAAAGGGGDAGGGGGGFLSELLGSAAGGFGGAIGGVLGDVVGGLFGGGKKRG